MAPKRPSIPGLVHEGRLMQIRQDRDEALELLGHGETHLASAEKVLDEDPAGAYQLLYDAARKAVAADMLANGYRAKADRPGAHAAVVLYAEEALAADCDPEALANFDQMRRSRNRTEYGAVTLGTAQINADLGHARAIVEAVRRRLS